MTPYETIVLFCVLAVVGASLRFVKPGTVLIGPRWNGKYSVKAAPEVFSGAYFAIRMAPWLPWGPTLHFHENAPLVQTEDSVSPDVAEKEIRKILKYSDFLSSTSLLILFYFLFWVGFVLLSGMVFRPWFVLGVGLILIQIPHLVLVGWSHARLHPGKIGLRIQYLVTMTMFPPEGVFAADLVSAGMLNGVHPLVAALILCPEKEARQIMTDYLRRWKYPLESENQTRAAEGLTMAERLCEQHDWTMEDLLPVPGRDGLSSLAYCPRCLGQYMSETARCPDCPGVDTVSF
jgi:hypothetical protein